MDVKTARRLGDFHPTIVDKLKIQCWVKTT